jgi:hypothetical protein
MLFISSDGHYFCFFGIHKSEKKQNRWKDVGRHASFLQGNRGEALILKSVELIFSKERGQQYPQVRRTGGDCLSERFAPNV